MKLNLFTALLVSALATSCDRKKPSESTTAVESTAVSAARTDEDMLRNEVARGLEELIHHTMIPVGDIEIMGGLSSQMHANDWDNRRFSADFLGYLQFCEEKQLVSFRQQQQSDLAAIGRMGAQTVTVTPTDRAKKAANPKVSTDKILKLQYETCKITQIVRSAPYQSPTLSQSEEYRLVLGTYRTTPTTLKKELMPDVGELPERKFRALMKLNPFTKRYVFVTADWGMPEREEWMTQNIQ